MRKDMTTVIIGAGITGMRLALLQSRSGAKVSLLESASAPGGLTGRVSWAYDGREVGVDRFYHVILESDATLRALLDDLGLADRVLWTSAPAELISGSTAHPASSIVQMALLPALSLVDRARIGFSLLASLALPLRLADRTTSAAWLRRAAGESAFRSFWGPMLRAKLGTQADRVSATFIASTVRRLIRARLKGDGDRFGVIPGGYAPVFEGMRNRLLAAGGEIRTDATVVSVTRQQPGQPLRVTLADGEVLEADEVFLTTPGPVTTKLVPQLTDAERRQLTDQPYLGVICGVYLLDTPPNDAYITYLVDDVGLTGVIGMHALLPPEHTGGGYLVYLPHYCASDDPWFDEDTEALSARLLDGMRRSFPDWRGTVLASAVNKARYVVPLPLPGAEPPLPHATSIPGLRVVSTAQNQTGTLNVEGSLRMADEAWASLQNNTWGE